MGHFVMPSFFRKGCAMFSLLLGPRKRAAICAFFVTVLWSSSWVLIKIGLRDEIGLPPLPFAGLRYSVAFLCLIAFVLGAKKHRAALRQMPIAHGVELALHGVVAVTLTQGAQFAALSLLPSPTVSLLLNLTTPLVALAGIKLLGERPKPQQWAGIGLAICGVLFYFGLLTGTATPLPSVQRTGLVVGGMGLVFNVVSSLSGRRVNRDTRLSPLVVTAVSMGAGAFCLLTIGIWFQGVPHPTLHGWGIIVWLALVNTALAFTLWNYSLRFLTAMESSLINSTMLIQISFLSWCFLGEMLSPQKIAGISLSVIGIFVVQTRLSAHP